MPAVGQLLLELVREYAVRPIADDRDIRKLLYCEREGLAAAENRIAGQKHDWPGELCFALRFDVPSPQRFERIFAWANLRLPVEGYTATITKSIDDRDRSAVVSTGAITYVDDKAV